MAAGGSPTIGKAYIELHADSSPFDRELGQKVKEGVDKNEPVARREGEKLGSKLGDGVGAGFKKKTEPEFRNTFQRIGNLFSTHLRKWGNEWEKTFQKMAKGNFIVTRVFGELILGATKVVKVLFNIGSALFQFGQAVGDALVAVGQLAIEGFKTLAGAGGDATRAMTSFSSAMARVGASVVAAASEIASFLPAAAAMVAVVTLLAAAFGALLIVVAVVLAPFATLLNFALAIPAALTAFLAILLPLIISLHNLGDVMKLVGETDQKKFSDGMKKLSKPLQQLTLVLRSLKPLFAQISSAIQTAFFGPILKVLAPSLKKLGPSLIAGLTPVAGALGSLIAQVITFLSSPEIQGFLMTTLPQVAGVLNTMAPSIIAMLSALVAAAAAATPLVKDMGTAFSGWLQKFAEWLQTAINDGRFQKWLQDAKDSLNSIMGLVNSLINLFKTLFSNLDNGGRSFLDTLTKAINKFTAWLQSDQGKKAMENMVVLAKLFADAFSVALNYVTKVLTVVNLIVDAWRWLNSHSLGALGGNNSGGKLKTFPASGRPTSPNQLTHYSGGGVVPYDQMAIVHKGEPILDPANTLQRNRHILASAGMLDAVGGNQQPEVNVYIGDQRLDERIDFRVGASSRATSRALMAGTR
jgi:hypothetical protein